MTHYLLDTNHTSPLVTMGHPLRQRIFARLDAGDTFSLCIPTLAETLYGIGILPRSEANLAEWERVRPLFECYIPDEADALIAACALRLGYTLLTTDGDFESIRQLPQENWLL